MTYPEALADLLDVDREIATGLGNLALAYGILVALVCIIAVGAIGRFQDRRRITWFAPVCVGLVGGAACAAGIHVWFSPASAEARSRIAETCPVVLDGISSGSIRYLGDTGARNVSELCGEREFILAANAPGSRLRTAARE